VTSSRSERVATVFGSSRLSADSPEYAAAQRLGRTLVEAGYAVTSGGYAGLMSAVSQGAREAGGHVVGVTMASWTERLKPNQWVVFADEQPSLFARLERLMEADVLIALDGGPGTLAEVMLAWNLLEMNDMPPRPLILVGPRWPPILEAIAKTLVIDPAHLQLLTTVATVEGVLPAIEAWRPAQLEGAHWKG
jgi:uncharacterized protein (TIGR00730 family)